MNSSLVFLLLPLLLQEQLDQFARKLFHLKLKEIPFRVNKLHITVYVLVES